MPAITYPQVNVETYLLTHPQIIQTLLDAGGIYDDYSYQGDHWSVPIRNWNHRPYTTLAWSSRATAIAAMSQNAEETLTNHISWWDCHMDPQLIAQVPAGARQLLLDPDESSPVAVVAGDDVLLLRGLM